MKNRRSKGFPRFWNRLRSPMRAGAALASCWRRDLPSVVAWAWAVLALVAAGCQWGNPLGFTPVEGHVTFDGQPLEAGEVRFVPDSAKGNKGPMSIGALGPGGRFVLRGPGARVGAVPGPHRVYLVSPFVNDAPEPPIMIDGKEVSREELAGGEKAAPRPTSWKVPRKFLAAETSELSAVVEPRKPNVVDLEISAPVRK